ncbi:Na(+)-translocating NADH-quinone reductase subunit C [Flavobacteriaceae bacterium]|nr:Na(+)-translocating NADH-quinone reductase subunit C [Flavobacteriaceae bacterium]
MAINTDKNSYTIIFAIIMVVVVGSILSFASQGLKGNIDENKRIEKQQNILYALGINENDESSVTFVSKSKVSELFLTNITKQLVIQGTDVTENNEAYLIDVKKQKALAKDPSYARKLPLFISESKSGTYYVIPILGKGLWDAIWGYVAIDKDMVIKGVYFDHKGETPGLGANINKRFFMDDFTGEHLSDSSGKFTGVVVTKGNGDPRNNNKTDNKVDAIAGSTITGNGVTSMIKDELKLYIPYFKTLKNS